MASLKSILKPSAEGVITVRGVDIKLVYRPEMLTPEFEESLEVLTQNGRKGPALANMILTAVQTWDLKMEDSDTEPIPLTPEGLRKIPMEIQAEIVSEIMGMVIPDPKSEASYESGSEPAAE